MRRQSYADRRAEYNRAVLAELGAISPAHALALDSRGTGLGWWPTVAYLHDTGRPASDAAQAIARMTIPPHAV